MREIKMITQEKLKHVVNYNKDTGWFRWNVYILDTVKLGQFIGTKEDTGKPVQIEIDGKSYSAHRLAWLYVYGEMPDKCITHINGNKKDNRISNLKILVNVKKPRNVITSINSKISLDRDTKKWIVQIKINGKEKYLESFENMDQAIEEKNNHEVELLAKQKHITENFISL